MLEYTVHCPHICLLHSKVFPKEYKRVLQDEEDAKKAAAAQQEAQQLSATLSPGNKRPAYLTQVSAAPDVIEGEEGYPEDIMQGNPRHTVQVRTATPLLFVISGFTFCRN